MITSKQRIKNKIQLETEGFDILLDQLIVSATEYINTICSTEILEGDYVERYTMLPKVILRHSPVNSIERIREYSTDNDLVIEDDYILDERIGILYIVNPTMNVKDLEITYNAGYTASYDEYGNLSEGADTVPADLREIAENIIIRKFKKRESVGKDSESFGDSTIKWSDDISSEEMRIIKAYSRLRHSH